MSENIEVNKESDPVFHPFFDRMYKLTDVIALKNGVFGNAHPKAAKKLLE